MKLFNGRMIERRWILDLGIFTFMVNLLLLVMPLYLLQIYDRILASGSLETLLYLTLISVGALVVLGLLEAVRAQYAGRIAARLELRHGDVAFLAAISPLPGQPGDAQPLRDLQTVRNFLGSRAVFFLFDLPFAPFFIAILALVHPILFWVTVAGALIMLAIAYLNQRSISGLANTAAQHSGASMELVQTYNRNAETLHALGMIANANETWGAANAQALSSIDALAAVNARWGGVSRAVRIIFQLAILGAGAWLVLDGKMTGGMIFAASIISGRALTPLDQIIGSWRQIVDAQSAWNRLSALIEDNAKRALPERTSLPDPHGKVDVENLVYFVPGSAAGGQPLIKRISFHADAGDIIAIVGPSRAGKSTLARLLVRAIDPASGVVRLDDADLKLWDRESLGRKIGYLPQDVELIPGTIAQNIARFDPEARDEAIIDAAMRAEAHSVALAMPNGYETRVGAGGTRLSGGERQRIGLARAMYGAPKLLILDEPNASLDQEGEEALVRALVRAREEKVTTFIITHKPSLAAVCDKILVMREGQIQAFGPASDIMGKLQAPPRSGGQPAPVVDVPPSAPTQQQRPAAYFANVVPARKS